MKQLLMIIALTGIGFSAPAYQGEIDFKQSDGSNFIGHLKGDEYFSWIEDKQGHIITYNFLSKNYEFAILKDIKGKVELEPSGVKVSPIMAGQLTSSFNTKQSKIDKNQLTGIWKRKKEAHLYHN